MCLTAQLIRSLCHWPLQCWFEIYHVPCPCRIAYMIDNSNKDDNDCDIYFLKFPNRIYNFVNMLLMNWREHVILIPWLIFGLVKFVEPKSCNMRFRFYTKAKENYDFACTFQTSFSHLCKSCLNQPQYCDKFNNLCPATIGRVPNKSGYSLVFLRECILIPFLFPRQVWIVITT